MSTIIQVNNLFKNFSEVKAVDDLSFEVPEGIVYGFLGQNGAGKSTTIRILLSLIQPTSGEIKIFGEDLKRKRKEILRQVGAIIERPDLYKFLTGIENLKIFAQMSGVRVPEKKLMEHLDRVGLSQKAFRKVKTFSQGMKQRLGLAIALVHDPKLIILDEPTNGLDPQGLADVRNLILHLSKDLRKTIFISSHLLSEMELIADSMLIIDKGKKVVEGQVNDLFDPSKMVVQLRTTDDATSFEMLEKSDLKKFLYEKRADSIVLKLHKDEIPGLLKKLIQMDIGVISLDSRHSLEDYFLSLTTGQQHVDTFKN